MSLIAALTTTLRKARKVRPRNPPVLKFDEGWSGLVAFKRAQVMSEQQIIYPSAPPRRQDARGLQSRLYREIGLAAVEAAICENEAQGGEIHTLFAARDDRATVLALPRRLRA